MSKYNNPYKLGTCQSTTTPINLVHVKVQQQNLVSPINLVHVKVQQPLIEVTYP